MNDEQILRFAQLYFQRPVEVIFSLSAQCCPETTLARGVWPHNHHRRPICLQVTRSMRMFSILLSIKVSFFLCSKFSPYLIYKHFLQMLFSKKTRHYLSYKKRSQTKCYKQSDTIFQLSFHCSFRCCTWFCSLCCPLRPLLLIGGKLSTANQDPSKEWF